jgi:hypothetical protein
MRHPRNWTTTPCRLSLAMVLYDWYGLDFMHQNVWKDGSTDRVKLGLPDPAEYVSPLYWRGGKTHPSKRNYFWDFLINFEQTIHKVKTETSVTGLFSATLCFLRKHQVIHVTLCLKLKKYHGRRFVVVVAEVSEPEAWWEQQTSACLGVINLPCRLLL